MKSEILVVSYSLSGNNALLAESVASKLGAEHQRLTEARPRDNGKIALDMLIGRYPAVEGIPRDAASYPLVVFFGPVWMFGVPSPLRTCFKALKGAVRKYAFVSLSGGALGPNVALQRDLRRRMGKNLALCLDINVAHYCQVPASPGPGDTATYRLADHEDDLGRISGFVADAIRAIRV